MKSKRMLALMLGAIIASGSVSQAAIQVYADLEDPSAFASMSDSFPETTKAEHLTKMTNLNGSKFEELLRDKSIHINSENLYISGSELVFKLLENNEAKLVCYGGDPQNVTVPQYVSINDKAYPVTSIGARAFDRCTSLQSIEIPEGVTEIAMFAFYNCTNLQSIILPNSVTKIGSYAFDSCENLKSIEIPDDVTYLGSGTFAYCTNLESIVLSKGLKEIGYSAFASCTSLQSIVLPDGVTKISRGAFGSCTNLQSIVLPKGVTKIGKKAFHDCTSLQSVYLPKGVTKIGDTAFMNCTNLQSIVLPDGVTEIGKKAFAGTNIADIYIPAGVTTLKENSLEAENLESILVNERCNLSDSDIEKACGEHFYKVTKPGEKPKTVEIHRDINMDTLTCALMYKGRDRL